MSVGFGCSFDVGVSGGVGNDRVDPVGSVGVCSPCYDVHTCFLVSEFIVWGVSVVCDELSYFGCVCFNVCS